MNEVCHEPEIEPKVETLQCEIFVHNPTTPEDEARLDLKANGLWVSRISRPFFDVNIFSPCQNIAKTAERHILISRSAEEFQLSAKNFKERVVE